MKSFGVANCSCIIKGKSRPFTIFMSLNTYPSALLYPSMAFSTFDLDCDQLVKVSQCDWKESRRICQI